MTRIEERLRIERDGTIVALSGKVEYGQGIRTGFAKIVADEMRVPIDRVRVVLGETDETPWDMGTFGSMSTAVDGNLLRAVAAHARRALIARASAKLGVGADRLEAKDGAVRAGDGRSIAYAELAPIEGEVPEGVVEKGAPAVDAPMRLEAIDIVTGAGRYAADVRLPGMLRGHAVRAAVCGSTVKRVEADAARSMPGVVAVVHEGDFVGVVAQTTGQALHAARAIEIEWDAPPPDDRVQVLTLRGDEGVDEALAAAKTRIRARFEVPHVSNAPIGPAAAVADVRDDEAHVWVATQRPFPLRDEVAEMLRVPKERVHVHLTLASGTYGRNGGSDAAIDAVRLSRATKRPVLVQWTRAEEFRAGPSRPEVIVEVDTGLDENGNIAAWRSNEHTQPHTYGGANMPPQIIVMTSGRNAVPEYRAPRDVKLHLGHARVRTGAFRSLAAAPNVFAIESTIDELARAANEDAIEFRLRHLDDPRARRVLEKVREASGWRTRKKAENHGFGVACAIYHSSYVAQVVEIALERRVRLERVWCVVDPGRVVHPDGARNQIEGAIQQAASWALMEELHHRDGVVREAAWSDYPIATFRDAPRSIEVTLIDDPSARSTAVGETGTVPVAAALANAVFDACGVRVRRLPLTPEAIARGEGA